MKTLPSASEPLAPAGLHGSPGLIPVAIGGMIIVVVIVTGGLVTVVVITDGGLVTVTVVFCAGAVAVVEDVTVVVVLVTGPEIVEVTVFSGGVTTGAEGSSCFPALINPQESNPPTNMHPSAPAAYASFDGRAGSTTSSMTGVICSGVADIDVPSEESKLGLNDSSAILP